jgi:dienelactone hydrolase
MCGALLTYLEQLDFVDSDKIGVVGICAGGGYAVAAAKADYRLMAVATISMVNIGDSARLGWYGDEPASKHVETLKQAAQQMKAENNGAERAAAPYVPPQLDDQTPYDLKEAHELLPHSKSSAPPSCKQDVDSKSTPSSQLRCLSSSRCFPEAAGSPYRRGGCGIPMAYREARQDY